MYETGALHFHIKDKTHCYCKTNSIDSDGHKLHVHRLYWMNKGYVFSSIFVGFFFKKKLYVEVPDHSLRITHKYSRYS